MNLSQPGGDLFGDAEARVLHRLAILAEGASGRRIHELARVPSLRTTQTILDRLVSIGLVHVRRVGSANDYRLNREHILWDPIERVLNAPARLEAQIASILEDVLDALVDNVSLYGSFARGDARRDADIDLLIVWRDDEIALDERTELLHEVSSRINRISGNQVQPLAMTRRELGVLVEEHDPLVDSLREDGRDLVVRSARLEDLLKGDGTWRVARAG